MAELAVYDNDPTLYLFTSLTAGSSHIVTATSRIETILRANKIPFKGVDTATDDLARKLFQRRAQGKKLPLLVKEGYVLGVRTSHRPNPGCVATSGVIGARQLAATSPLTCSAQWAPH